VKGKLNMALWLGLPIVASSMAAEGMGLVDGESMLLASTPEEFARATSRLYGDYELWSRLRRGGYAINEKYYSRRLATRVLNETLTFLKVARPQSDSRMMKCRVFEPDVIEVVGLFDSKCMDSGHPLALNSFQQFKSSLLRIGGADFGSSDPAGKSDATTDKKSGQKTVIRKKFSIKFH
jgi:hypothetical protein